MRFEEEIAREQQRFVDRYEEASARLRRVPGVLSVGVGARERAGELMPELAFRVYVATKIRESELPESYRVPRTVFGLPTDVIVKPVVDELQSSSSSSAFAPNWDSIKYRPLRGGSQLRSEKFEGDNKRGMGTLGCLGRMADGTVVALTAQHVSCAGTEYNLGTGSSGSSTSLGAATGFACVGVKIGQPRHITCCCCCTFNEIGAVLRAQKTAQVDCATVKLDTDIVEEITTGNTINDVVDIGALTGVAQAVCFSEVRKRGAATRLTRGTVIDVLYEGSQILIHPLPGFPKFAHFGDSGAVIVNSAGRVVGLLWGADRGTRNRGVANHIGPVLSATGIIIAGDPGAGLGIPTTSCGSSSSVSVPAASSSSASSSIPSPSSSSSRPSSSSSSSSSSRSSSSSSSASSSSRASSSSALSSSSSSSSSSFVCPAITFSIDASDTRSHRIPSTRGAGGAIHFVTARGSGNLVLRARIVPDVPDAAIMWEAVGGTITSPGVGADGHTARISRATAAHLQVRLRIDGRICRQCHVWVVSATGSRTARRAITVTTNAAQTVISGGYNFSFAVQPATIVSNAAGADIPDLTGANTTAPPDVTATDVDVSGLGDSLAGGADHKWDISRRVRRRIINPAGLVYPGAGDFWVTHLNYPTNGVVGNDDRATADETNDPYVNAGNITSQDDPQDDVLQGMGADGDTFEKRLHFGEFARVELDGHWYRISSYYDWRIHFRFLKVAGVWTDDGSTLAEDNAGF